MKYYPVTESELRENPQILDNRFYKGYEYYIVNRGTHPTAYIKLPKTDKFYGWGYDDLSEVIDVHGGFTYCSDKLSLDGSIGNWFIGWDYAHYMDYTGFEILEGNDYNHESNEKHSTFKILEDVIDVVNQLKEQNNRSDSCDKISE